MFSVSTDCRVLSSFICSLDCSPFFSEHIVFSFKYIIRVAQGLVLGGKWNEGD